MDSNTVFSYTYSAKQNEEVQAIRNKYLPRPESKLEELKRLDQCVQYAGIAQALVVGVLGCMIFGLGMCLAMQVIGQSMAVGVFIGALGAAAMIAAYPVYRSFFRKTKEKYRPRILELAAELCGQIDDSLVRKESL